MTTPASPAAGGVPARLIDLVRDVPMVAVVVQLGAGRMGRVVAASPVATERLGQGRSLVGSDTASLLGRPATELAMLHDGRLRAFESDISVTPLEGPPVRLKVWVRAIEDESPVAHALVLAVPASREAALVDDSLRRVASAGHHQAIGSADAELVIDRVSADVVDLLGWSTEDVIGRSLLQLVAPADIPTLMVALGQVASSGRGVCIEVRLRTAEAEKLCECVLVPLHPAPSVAFALSEISAGERARAESPSRDLLARMQSRVGAAHASQLLSEHAAAPFLSKLTSREWEIVEHLLAGDRVPAIASAMYLSQSTVRSHLSQVFAKLGVTSQQELIHLLRDEKRRSVQAN